MKKFNQANQQKGFKERNYGCNQRNYSKQRNWTLVQIL